MSNLLLVLSHRCCYENGWWDQNQYCWSLLLLDQACLWVVEWLVLFSLCLRLDFRTYLQRTTLSCPLNQMLHFYMWAIVLSADCIWTLHHIWMFSISLRIVHRVKVWSRVFLTAETAKPDLESACFCLAELWVVTSLDFLVFEDVHSSQDLKWLLALPRHARKEAACLTLTHGLACCLGFYILNHLCIWYVGSITYKPGLFVDF